MSAGAVLGLIPGTLYAILVGLVNFAVYGPRDQAPTFPLAGVLVGVLFGLLGGIVWTLSGETALESNPHPVAIPPSAEAVNTHPGFFSASWFCRMCG
jgi:hypothetical protein